MRCLYTILMALTVTAFSGTTVQDGAGCTVGPNSKFPSSYPGYSWRTVYCDTNGVMHPPIGMSCDDPDLNLGRPTDSCTYKTTQILLPYSVPATKPVRPIECVKCGDGICESSETKQSCKSDCAPKTPPPPIQKETQPQTEEVAVCTFTGTASDSGDACHTTENNSTNNNGTASGGTCQTKGNIMSGMSAYCECHLCNGGTTYIGRPSDTLNVKCSKACRDSCSDNSCSGSVDLENQPQATAPPNSDDSSGPSCQLSGGACSSGSDCCSSAPYCRSGSCSENSSNTGTTTNTGNTGGSGTGGSGGGNSICIPLNGVLTTTNIPCCSGGSPCNSFCRASCTGSGGGGGGGSGTGSANCVGSFTAGSCACCNSARTTCGDPGGTSAQTNATMCSTYCAGFICSQ